MQPFSELRIHKLVLGQLAAMREVNPKLGDCLDNAFHEIRKGALRLSDPTHPTDLPRYTQACGYLIMVSDLGKTGVVTGLQPRASGELLS